MSRTKTPEETPKPKAAEVIQLVATPEMKQVAYSFFKGKDGWKVSKIRFNADSATVGTLEIVENCESESEALARFKISVARDIMKRENRE